MTAARAPRTRLGAPARPRTSAATSPSADPGAAPDAVRTRGAGEPPREVEVKLAVHDTGAIRALLDHPDPSRLAGFDADGAVEVREIVDLYLDTDTGAGALRAAGLRARLRVSSRGVTLTVKGRSAQMTDGVTTRMELEGPATPDLDPIAWPPSDARDLVVETIGREHLVEIAALRQRRHTRMLRNGPATVELSLDELSALEGAGGMLATRVELEAELKSGTPEALAPLARALSTVAGLGPPLGSKLEFALSARAER